MSSGWDGKEEVMMQMFMSEPMSNAKVQSSNETPHPKDQKETF
jgi:hypothetical protein